MFNFQFTLIANRRRVFDVEFCQNRICLLELRKCTEVYLCNARWHRRKMSFIRIGSGLFFSMVQSSILWLKLKPKIPALKQIF